MVVVDEGKDGGKKGMGMEGEENVYGHRVLGKGRREGGVTKGGEGVGREGKKCVTDNCSWKELEGRRGVHGRWGVGRV